MGVRSPHRRAIGLAAAVVVSGIGAPLVATASPPDGSPTSTAPAWAQNRPAKRAFDRMKLDMQRLTVRLVRDLRDAERDVMVVLDMMAAADDATPEQIAGMKDELDVLMTDTLDWCITRFDQREQTHDGRMAECSPSEAQLARAELVQSRLRSRIDARFQAIQRRIDQRYAELFPAG